jgi:hypothetical protein
MIASTKAPLFEVRKSRIQGKGVFAARPIRRGARIAEYEGEHIDAEEATRRYDDMSMKRHHTFLFDLDGETCIDGAVGGNDSRFINHSCEPNCEAIQEDDRIFVVALRSIAPGEELCYDYRYVVEGPIDETMRRLYACRCGTATCRGTILQPEPKKAPKKKAVAKKVEAKKAPKKLLRSSEVRAAKSKRDEAKKAKNGSSGAAFKRSTSGQRTERRSVA